MQTMCLKDPKSVFSNLVTPIPLVPNGSAISSQATHDESLSKFRSISRDHSSIEDQLTVAPCQSFTFITPFKEDDNMIKFHGSPGKPQVLGPPPPRSPGPSVLLRAHATIPWDSNHELWNPALMPVRSIAERGQGSNSNMHLPPVFTSHSPSSY